MEVGEKVTRVKVGDNVGVGCIRDSCLICEVCHRGEECYCENGMTHTYNTLKKKVGFPFSYKIVKFQLFFKLFLSEIQNKAPFIMFIYRRKTAT